MQHTITVAKSAGFCFGVDRAVKLAYEALQQHQTVATLGPIIHNQNVVDDLLKQGARIVDDVSQLQPGECVVIRSHGVSADVYALARLLQKFIKLSQNILHKDISS